ncbi:glycosyltransferase [Aureimonas sp. AU22]|uniref:glycosyltransferase family 2 protein n=1 Tax=Aureimonas sp. AU22 TaxID=1638162 RepID=UPI0007849442|nr:glycosyltransferase [Aureimonas sp. AU22]
MRRYVTTLRALEPDRSGGGASATAGAAAKTGARVVFDGLPADLPSGLYRLRPRSGKRLDVTESLQAIVENRDGTRTPLPLSAHERSIGGETAIYFVLPPHVRDLEANVPLQTDPSDVGTVEVRRVSTTLHRVRRAGEGALSRLRHEGAVREIAGMLWSAYRRGGLGGLRRTLREGTERASRRVQDEANWRLDAFAQRTAADNAAVVVDLQAGIAEAGRPTLSLIVPVYKPRPEWFGGLLASLAEQTDQDFEAIFVFDGPQEDWERACRDAPGGTFARRTITLDRNEGVSAATNAGIRAATGDYTLVLDHDDLVDPSLVALFRAAAASTGADMLYADEAIADEEMARILRPLSRGRFDLRFYLSHPYIVHPIAIRRSVSIAAGLLDESMAVSHDVDYFLRCVGQSRSVTHIPLVLYYWRTHAGSLGHEKRDLVARSTRNAIERFLGANTAWPRFDVTDGATFNTYVVRPPLPDGARAAVVIPTRNRGEILATCLRSIEATRAANTVPFDVFVIDHESDEPATTSLLREETDAGRITVLPHSGPWNYAEINNAAVRPIVVMDRHSHLVFMNNDIELRTPDWLDAMLTQFAYGDVGAVGCCLTYPTGEIQHAGVIVGLFDKAEHSHKFLPYDDVAGKGRDPGYMGSLVATRDYAAVTAALMAVPVAAFQSVGGFDEKLAVGFNDTDLCLRLGEIGLASTYVGSVTAIHYESISRGKSDTDTHPDDTHLFTTRHAASIRDGDPHWGLMMNWSSTRADVMRTRQKPFRLRTVPVRLPRADA